MQIRNIWERLKAFKHVSHRDEARALKAAIQAMPGKWRDGGYVEDVLAWAQHELFAEGAVVAERLAYDAASGSISSIEYKRDDVPLSAREVCNEFEHDFGSGDLKSALSDSALRELQLRVKTGAEKGFPFLAFGFSVDCRIQRRRDEYTVIIRSVPYAAIKRAA